MIKLDYRCQGTGCKPALSCRRFMIGPEAKNCTLPFAAFDMRDTVVCDGYLARVDAVALPAAEAI